MEAGVVHLSLQERDPLSSWHQTVQPTHPVEGALPGISTSQNLEQHTEVPRKLRTASTYIFLHRWWWNHVLGTAAMKQKANCWLCSFSPSHQQFPNTAPLPWSTDQSPFLTQVWLEMHFVINDLSHLSNDVRLLQMDDPFYPYNLAGPLCQFHQSHILLLKTLSEFSAPNFSFLLACTLGGSRWWLNPY